MKPDIEKLARAAHKARTAYWIPMEPSRLDAHIVEAILSELDRQRTEQGFVVVPETVLNELRGAAVNLIVETEQAAVRDWPQGADGSDIDRTWDAVSATYPTIWTEDQCAKLNEWQSAGHVHPFTCEKNDSWHHDEDGDRLTLEATPQGWLCRSCGYRQFWAHDFMFNGPPEKLSTRAMLAAHKGTAHEQG